MSTLASRYFEENLGVTVVGPLGQKTMAQSISVAIASDQSALSADVTDRNTRQLGRVQLWDTVDLASVLPARSFISTSDAGLVVMKSLDKKLGFEGVSNEFTPAITIGVKPGFTLWHPNTQSPDTYILHIGATIVVSTAATAGRGLFQLQQISADGATGTTGSAQLDQQSGASGLTYRSNPGTDGTGVGSVFAPTYFGHATLAVGTYNFTLWDASSLEEAILLRSGSNAGLKCNINNIVAFTALVYTVNFQVRWLEF